MNSRVLGSNISPWWNCVSCMKKESKYSEMEMKGNKVPFSLEWILSLFALFLSIFFIPFWWKERMMEWRCIMMMNLLLINRRNWSEMSIHYSLTIHLLSIPFSSRMYFVSHVIAWKYLRDGMALNYVTSRTKKIFHDGNEVKLSLQLEYWEMYFRERRGFRRRRKIYHHLALLWLADWKYANRWGNSKNKRRTIGVETLVHWTIVINNRSSMETVRWNVNGWLLDWDGLSDHTT